MPCGGDLLNSPNRGRKDTVQNGSGLPFWAYFFFPAGPVPLYILQDGPASLGARKVLRPICGRSGIFPATATTTAAKQRRRRWVCVSSSHNHQREQQQQTTSKQANAHEHKSVVHQATRGARPPPRPVHECVGVVCLPYVIARRSYF